MSAKPKEIAEVFWIAFKNLDPKSQEEIIRRIIADERLREEIFDAVLIESRKDEPVEDFEKYVTGLED